MTNSHDARTRAEALDRADPIAHCRERFEVPDGLLYLDGNSLGALPKAVAARVAEVVAVQWGRGLVGSWNDAGWVDLPRRVGSAIGRLVGAPEGTLVACDSTSVNLFKLIAAALDLRPGRKVIVSERRNFPTDLYVAEGVAAFAARGHSLRLVDEPEDLGAALGEDVALVMLTHVDYRTGRMHDMAEVSRAIHAHGALALWDLAHSAGAVPVDLACDGADFAVGCGYKYLNGGPGAPAFLYVAEKHHATARQPLTGWFGHAAPFAFESSFRPRAGIDGFLTGTPSVIAMSALEAALTAFDGISMDAVRRKSMQLCELFIACVAADGEHLGLTLVGPRAAAGRGSQVSFVHENAYGLCQALIERGVVGDFRAPDIMRFGFTPLYIRFVDVVDAATILLQVLRSEAWREERYQTRRAVT